MEYQSPVIELTELEAEDVLCASPVTMSFSTTHSPAEDSKSGWGGEEKEF